MPTYEYECQKCGITFERFQQMTDSPLDKCPECGGKVKRLFGTGANVILKGTGSRAAVSPADGEPCCGLTSPCEDPKRCCQK